VKNQVGLLTGPLYTPPEAVRTLTLTCSYSLPAVAAFCAASTFSFRSWMLKLAPACIGGYSMNEGKYFARWCRGNCDEGISNEEILFAVAVCRRVLFEVNIDAARRRSKRCAAAMLTVAWGLTCFIRRAGISPASLRSPFG
jgi:hypothetical protein